MPTETELLALADRLDELGDSRAQIARSIRGICDRTDIGQLLRLLTESDQHEAACVFAEHALLLQREHGREPDPRSWSATEAKRAWLRGEMADDELRSAAEAAQTAFEAVSEVTEAAWLIRCQTRGSVEPDHEGGLACQAAQAAVCAAAPAMEWETADGARGTARAVGQLAVWAVACEAVFAKKDAEETLAAKDTEGTLSAWMATWEAALRAEEKWQADWIMERAWGGERPAT